MKDAGRRVTTVARFLGWLEETRTHPCRPLQRHQNAPANTHAVFLPGLAGFAMSSKLMHSVDGSGFGGLGARATRAGEKGKERRKTLWTDVRSIQLKVAKLTGLGREITVFLF